MNLDIKLEALPERLLNTRENGPIVLVAPNRKGGVAKTTTLQILAPFAAYVCGLKVLLIDLDIQANLSLRYVNMIPSTTGLGWVPDTHPNYDPDDDDWERPDYSVRELFENHFAVPYPTSLENLEIIPCNSDAIEELNYVIPDNITLPESELMKRSQRERTLEALFSLPDFKNAGYDMVMIDTPPNLGPLALSAIRSATHCLIPCEMEPMSVEGLSAVIGLIQEQSDKKEYSDPIEIIGVLATKYIKNKTIQEKLYDYLNEDVETLTVLENKFLHRTDITKLSANSDEFVVKAEAPFIPSFAKSEVRNMCTKMCVEIFEKMGFQFEVVADLGGSDE